MRGLLIVNDAPPPMAPEWHPESDEFHLVEAALSRQHLLRMAPNGTHSWCIHCHIRQGQPLYQHFLSELTGAGDENRTRVLSVGKKRAVRRIWVNKSGLLGQVISLFRRR